LNGNGGGRGGGERLSIAARGDRLTNVKKKILSKFCEETIKKAGNGGAAWEHNQDQRGRAREEEKRRRLYHTLGQIVEKRRGGTANNIKKKKGERKKRVGKWVALQKGKQATKKAKTRGGGKKKGGHSEEASSTRQRLHLLWQKQDAPGPTKKDIMGGQKPLNSLPGSGQGKGWSLPLVGSLNQRGYNKGRKPWPLDGCARALSLQGTAGAWARSEKKKMGRARGGGFRKKKGGRPCSDVESTTNCLSKKGVEKRGRGWEPGRLPR